MGFIRLVLLWGWATAHASVVTQFIGTDDLLLDPPRMTEYVIQLRENGVKAITMPIAWSRLQPTADTFDLSVYDAGLDAVVAQGLQLILILDASGRRLLTANIELTGEYALPTWLIDKHPTALSVDFEGQRNGNLDYNDVAHLPDLQRFYEMAIGYYQGRYGDAILGFAPGVTHELEVKYAQHGYRWQSYSETTKAAFREWLMRNGLPESDPPVMNYANSLRGNAPRVEPLYPHWMTFREQQLARYVCRLTGWIREQSAQAYGYFGQSFSSHDGIYAVGILEEVVPCFDVVAVDFNFYDGWKTTPDWRVLPFLVNYAHHLGYPEVLAGVYLEQLYSADKPRLTAAELQGLRQTLRQLQREPTAGLEIGNVPQESLSQLQLLDLGAWQRQSVEERPLRVGIVAGKWTFYLWHGDYAFERQQIQDALLKTYELLVNDERFEVAVLGEKALIDNDLTVYDALIFAHQTTFSDAARAAIFNYYRRGGRLVQDIQFDAFHRDGRLRARGWADDLFGIAGRRANREGDRYVAARRRLRLSTQSRLYVTSFTLNPAEGFRLAMPRWRETQVGLTVMGPRTLVFGFQPQLVSDSKGTFWERFFVEHIAALIGRTD